ncbi:unnamed protein product [Ectocarpus sp. 8 AP-2014]
MIHDRARPATTRSAHDKYLSRANWLCSCRATRSPRRGSFVEEPSQRRPVLPPLPTYCTHLQTPPVLTEHPRDRALPKFQPHSSQWFYLVRNSLALLAVGLKMQASAQYLLFSQRKGATDGGGSNQRPSAADDSSKS